MFNGPAALVTAKLLAEQQRTTRPEPRRAAARPAPQPAPAKKQRRYGRGRLAWR